jgi:hypothetical protein
MYELIPYNEFKTLRLTHFYKPAFLWGSPIRILKDWEFMGGLWVGEAVGFTEFLCLTSNDTELGSVAIDLFALPEKTSNSIFDALNLQLKPNITRQEVEYILGNPHNTRTFVKDRTTSDFIIGTKWKYHIDCTIHETKGLIFIVVIRKDILDLCEKD